MKISTKMILLFSLITACMIVVNVVISTHSELALLEENRRTNLLTLANKMQLEIEQNISIMEYGIDEMAQSTSFLEALNTIAALGEAGENTSEYHRAQNTLSAALYHEPLNDNFFRADVITNDGFYISSHFEKMETLELYSDEIQERLELFLQSVSPKLSLIRKTLLPPHKDFWSVTRQVELYTVCMPAVYYGKVIGFLEVHARTSDLSSIFSAPDTKDFQAAAFMNSSTTPDGLPCVFYRAPGSTVSFEGLPLDGEMRTCLDANGVKYDAVGVHSNWLNMDIYAAQRSDVYTEMVNHMVFYHLFMGVLIYAASVVAIVLLSLGLTRSITRFRNQVLEVSWNEYMSSSPFDPQEITPVTPVHDREVHDLEKAFLALLTNLRQFSYTQNELRSAALRAQLGALQAQINPHFVYNTLNIIAAKAMEKGNFEIIDICDRFAQMLRHSTDLTHTTATLGEEVENVTNYLLLAKARYLDKLHYTIDVPECFHHIALPKLALQPIVENTITHGYQKSPRGIAVEIKAWLDADGRLHLRIRDDGQGFDEAMLNQLLQDLRAIEEGTYKPEEHAGHIGLVNTYRRLFYFGEGRMRMELRNDQGAVVELIMENTFGKETTAHV